MISVNDNVKAGTPNTTENLISFKCWRREHQPRNDTSVSFYKNATYFTSKILLFHCGGKCAILWLFSWPIPVFRLLWDFPRFSCEITWLLPTPLLAINKMFEVFVRLSSTEGAFQNRLFKIYKNAFFWKITGTENYWHTCETQLKHILITLSNLRMVYLSNWISGMSSIPLYQLN